jgi:hypothetical protein
MDDAEMTVVALAAGNALIPAAVGLR